MSNFNTGLVHLNSSSYSAYEITERFFAIKFKPSVKASTLVNENFTVQKHTDPSGEVTDPFEDINVIKDFYSITRILYLWWKSPPLERGTEYSVHIANVETITGNVLDPLDVFFTTPEGPPSEVDNHERPTRSPVDVEDYSIKHIADFSLNGSGSSPTSSDDIVEIATRTPAVEDSYNLSATANKGRIHLKFEEMIASNYVNRRDFNLQKKSLNAGVQGWSDVKTAVFSGPNGDEVMIYLPSQEDPPRYSYQISDISDSVFWEPGYKYRLILNPNIGN